MRSNEIRPHLGAAVQRNDLYVELTKDEKKEYQALLKEVFGKWKMDGKPSFDFFIDDKNLSIEDFKKNTNPKIGFIAGAFDVIHPGYIHMFELAKKNCEYLVVGLHNNPSIERGKPKPILSKEERKKILTSLKYVDEVFFYNTESELISLTENVKPDILFLGDDYIGKDHNGLKLNINTFFIPRKHGWSATKFKKMIKEQ